VLHAEVDDVSDLIEGDATHAFGCDYVQDGFALTFDVLHLFRHKIKRVYLLNRFVRVVFEILKHLGDLLGSVVLADVTGISEVVTMIVELHVNRLENTAIDAVNVNALVLVYTSLLE